MTGLERLWPDLVRAGRASAARPVQLQLFETPAIPGLRLRLLAELARRLRPQRRPAAPRAAADAVSLLAIRRIRAGGDRRRRLPWRRSATG
jgi:hypothetical protein